MIDLTKSGVFPHACEAGCGRTVQYDDEPYCFDHSPDDGSSVPGYSARTEALATRVAGLTPSQRLAVELATGFQEDER